jgi:type II secretory ATPase GspE/PulE/Tfp pilus assembly ATPase PilB-like protein
MNLHTPPPPESLPVPAGGGGVPAAAGKPLLGQYLLQKNLITDAALHSALMEQSVTNDRLGAILVRTGFLSYKDLIDALLYLDPARIATERVVRPRLDPDTLEEHQIILTAETEAEIYVSTMGSEAVVEEIVRKGYPEKKIVFTSFAPDNLGDFINRARATVSVSDRGNDDESLDRLVHQAISEGASDIHIEPKYQSYSVFFRHLGVRRHVYEGRIGEYQTVVAQIKDRSRMDLAERRLPQDGGFQVDYAGKLIDLRVATVPAKDGEKVVIRVLDPDRVQPRLSSLGITRIEEWRKGFTQMYGLCLCCGPTGSGKTTTLNATAREVDRFERAIYTVEDPVEYRIDYATQVGINEQVDLGFPRALRAFMRSDPDVIIVGEIRDEVTARNAIRAADTGHLVLATLHTGDIIGSISRLRDLDVPENHLIYMLRSVLVQNLVRAVCQTCRGTDPNKKAEPDCPKCFGTGYSHRTIVSECATFPDAQDWLRVIEGHRSWPTKLDDAMSKLDQGLVDEPELRRVFGSAIDTWLEKNKGLKLR